MTATLPVCVRGIGMSPHFIVVISVANNNYHDPHDRTHSKERLITLIVA